MLDVVIKKRTDSDDEAKDKTLRKESRQQVFTLVMHASLLKPIIIFTLTGLRPQELIALEWDHIDFETRTISVNWVLKRVVEFDDEGNVVFHSTKISKTKTPRGVRSIIMPNPVVEARKEWADYCAANNITSLFVLPSMKTGEMRIYSGLPSLLTRFIKTHGLDERITLYTFRHTYATVFLEERENPKIVASLMGHKKVSTTLNIYSFVVKNDICEKAAHTLDGVFENYPK